MSISTILEVFLRNRSVTTDSRAVEPGSVFFALKGEHFNGNQYAAKALESGATLAVVDEADIVVPGDDRYVLVEDGLRTLQLAAEAYRKSLSYPIFAITGTNGKTTTKELLHAVLATQNRVKATKGNLNNHIGVPLTLFSLPSDLDMAIVEMGANKRGDIAELAQIAHPSHGLLTNIGRAHLERFGDVEGVRKTKGELFDYLRAKEGCVYVNEGDRRVHDLGEGIGCRHSYGGKSSEVRLVEAVSSMYKMKLKVHTDSHGVIELETRLIGTHNAENVVAAVCVGLDWGISVENIQAAISGYVPRMNRTQLLQRGTQTILLDAYNANPSSMEATIKSVASQTQGKVALVLGDMFELGPGSDDMHNELVELAHETLPEALLIGVGTAMVKALAASEHRNVASFEKTADLEPEIEGMLEGFDFVLFKGSRGMALERLLKPLGVEA